jgi:branched-chain amino acid transport system substrate-binding protein
VSKHNERNPGKEVIYLNYAAVDPAMTNEKCDYWHFRLDADTSMKMEGIDDLHEGPAQGQERLPDQPELLARPAGRASYFKEGMARKRPDVKIAGEDLHPIGQVKDFRALCGQDQAVGRRYHRHRQLGR